MNEKEIRQSKQWNHDPYELQKLFERICRAIQNNEKEFIWNYKGLGEIKVKLREK